MNSKLNRQETDRYFRLAETAPVKIPKQAKVRAVQKSTGYEQLTFSWQSQGWRYVARWHSRLPGARIVTKPSWRVDRIKAGRGFGPHARHRVEETWSARGGWISSVVLHRSAWRANHSPHALHDIDVVKHTHFVLRSPHH